VKKSGFVPLFSQKISVSDGWFFLGLFVALNNMSCAASQACFGLYFFGFAGGS
jgi:hypothetical protein